MVKKVKTTDMNQKMKYRYDCILEDTKELQNDTKQVLNSQFEQLAKLTESGISNTPRLKNAMLEEADILSIMSDRFLKIHLESKAQADEIRTRIKEAELSEKDSKRKIKLKPMTNAQIDLKETKAQHFAMGATFFKLFWVFFIGCFAGVIIESIWCIVTNGYYESRTGLIYGPFNLVYGIGALLLTQFLFKYRNRSRIYSFMGGFIVGTVVEYGCSLFQEMVFGSVSWDYSRIPFNINGRVCLLYSIFWGILGVIWIKHIYPLMATWILKIPNKIGKQLTYLLLIFMIFNSFMSGCTTYRWYERQSNNPPSNNFEVWMDDKYPDTRMEKIYANLEFTK